MFLRGLLPAKQSRTPVAKPLPITSTNLATYFASPLRDNAGEVVPDPTAAPRAQPHVDNKNASKPSTLTAISSNPALTPTKVKLH